LHIIANRTHSDFLHVIVSSEAQAGESDMPANHYREKRPMSPATLQETDDYSGITPNKSDGSLTTISTRTEVSVKDGLFY
jgi:hypothetical protein